MKRLIAVWILAIVGLVGGCSSTTFLYNNADWLVREQVDDYFSITSIQEQQLDRNIGLFFKWHRKQELPEYANFISTLNLQFADGLTREELAGLSDQIADARRRFVEASLPSASQFLATTNDKQRLHFDREFQQRLAKDRESAELPIDEQNEENFSRSLENLEGWFGDFDEKQKQVLRRISDDRPNNYAKWLDRREQRQRELLKFLGGKPEAPAIKDYLYSRYVQPKDNHVDEQEGQPRQFWLSAMLQVDQILTTEQRQRAMRKLDEYRQDFIQLSEQKEPQERTQNDSK
jgi:hypothetical protein